MCQKEAKNGIDEKAKGICSQLMKADAMTLPWIEAFIKGVWRAIQVCDFWDCRVEGHNETGPFNLGFVAHFQSLKQLPQARPTRAIPLSNG